MVSEVSKYTEITYPAEYVMQYHMTYPFKVTRSTLGGGSFFLCSVYVGSGSINRDIAHASVQIHHGICLGAVGFYCQLSDSH